MCPTRFQPRTQSAIPESGYIHDRGIFSDDTIGIDALAEGKACGARDGNAAIANARLVAASHFERDTMRSMKLRIHASFLWI